MVNAGQSWAWSSWTIVVVVHDGRRHSHGQRCWIRLRASVAGDAGRELDGARPRFRCLYVPSSLSVSRCSAENAVGRPCNRQGPRPPRLDQQGQGWSAGARRRPERACSLRQGTNIRTVCFNVLTFLLSLLIAQLVCSKPNVEKPNNRADVSPQRSY